MTAWISSELPEALRVPGVYGVPRRRVRREPVARTDVAGFVGFEPRVRPVSAVLSPSTAIGPGHDFRIAIARCRVPRPTDGSGLDDDSDTGQVRIAGSEEFELSNDPSTVPMLPGEAVRFALVAVDVTWTEGEEDRMPASSPTEETRKRIRRRRNVVVVPGTAAPIGQDQAPDHAQLQAEVAIVALDIWNEPAQIAGSRHWVRLADVQVRRISNDAFRVTVIPADRLVRCDDWRDYVLRLGFPPDDGTFLGRSVRGFFACGGSRCYVTMVDRSEFDDEVMLARSLDQMLGDDADSARDATGVARLLHVSDVAIVDLPDLYAARVVAPTAVRLPPPRQDACFRPCVPIAGNITDAAGPTDFGEPLYDPATVAHAQIEFVRRCRAHRWRMMLLLCPPMTVDRVTGRFAPPSPIDVDAWRNGLHRAITDGGVGEQEEVSVAALYYPWLAVRETAGDPERQLPPTGFAAGVIAARDLRRGPAVSPANEAIVTATATTIAISEEMLANLYDPPRDADGYARPAVNVIRSAPGGAVELWGARTLSTDFWLRFIAVRRGLSAVQRRCYAALQRTVFEPNTPALWMQVTQIVLNVLMGLFRTGALRGSRPDEAFYIRCDPSVNPPESIAEGKLFIEVGVAIAAPAEFIVFRLGREEGIVEVLE